MTLKFPENREFNREFFGFPADSAFPGADSRSDFNALQPNSGNYKVDVPDNMM
jgi:hypothetical protein